MPVSPPGATRSSQPTSGRADRCFQSKPNATEVGPFVSLDFPLQVQNQAGQCRLYQLLPAQAPARHKMCSAQILLVCPSGRDLEEPKFCSCHPVTCWVCKRELFKGFCSS